MSRKKKILLAVPALFLAIQFIRPARNESNQILPTDITKIYAVPDSVQTVLREACYDCHSNHTRYPWYINIQPLGWLMANHIKDGKADLNFSDFGSYSLRKQKSKLRAIGSSIRENEMPLRSYQFMHPAARLSAADKTLIIDWATKTMDSITTKSR